MLMLLVQVTRAGKLHLCLVIWHTPEAIYLQLVGGCVQWWCHLAVKRRGYKSWVRNYFRFQ